MHHIHDYEIVLGPNTNLTLSTLVPEILLKALEVIFSISEYIYIYN